MIEQAKFTYFLLGKTLEKQTKTIEDQDKKQIKAIEDHGKQLVEPNELNKKEFNTDRDIYHMENKKEIFNELITGRSSEFHNLEKRISTNNLIYKCKTEGINPKDFGNGQNLIGLFKILIDGNTTPKEVLKTIKLTLNQI